MLCKDTEILFIIIYGYNLLPLVNDGHFEQIIGFDQLAKNNAKSAPIVYLFLNS